MRIGPLKFEKLWN